MMSSLDVYWKKSNNELYIQNLINHLMKFGSDSRPETPLKVGRGRGATRQIPWLNQQI